jgi:hypothetical protein
MQGVQVKKKKRMQGVDLFHTVGLFKKITVGVAVWRTACSLHACMVIRWWLTELTMVPPTDRATWLGRTNKYSRSSSWIVRASKLGDNFFSHRLKFFQSSFPGSVGDNFFSHRLKFLQSSFAGSR